MGLVDEIEKISDKLEKSQKKTGKIIKMYVDAKDRNSIVYKIFKKPIIHVIATRVEREGNLLIKEMELFKQVEIV